jgi:hypothetical protein
MKLSSFGENVELHKIEPILAKFSPNKNLILNLLPREYGML